MNSVEAVVEEVIGFHETLCGDWEDVTSGPIDPGMILQVPDEFPWQPLKMSGLEALRCYRDALNVLTDGTFSTIIEGTTADERLVAIRCHDIATRDGVTLEWTSLWTYVLTDDRVTVAMVVHALTGDKMAEFWGA